MSNELLELHMEQDQQRFESIDKKLDDGRARMGSIETKLDAVIATQMKQKGFIAGFSAAFSVLATSVIGLIVYIWQRYAG